MNREETYMTNKLMTGIDLHSNNLFCGIVEPDGTRVFEKRLPCDISSVLCALEPFKKRIHTIAVESTFNWYWLVDGLQDEGYNVVLAHATGMTQYNGLKHTDDKSDAFFVAELLRLNILPTGYLCDRTWRPVRDMLRRRMALVQKRTSLMLSLKSLHTRTTGEPLTQGQVKALIPETAEMLFQDSSDQLIARVQTQLLNDFADGIGQIEKEVLKKAADLPFFDVLDTLPGVGRILSLTIALETVDPARFEGPGNYASYCRCVDSSRISNGKKKGENNQKSGNKYLAWAFVEAANFAKRHDEKCRKFFDRKAAQTKNVVATKALACKLAKAAWHMMSEHVAYDASRIFPGPVVKPVGRGVKSDAAKTKTRHAAGAPVGRGQASPLRAATGGDASEGSKTRRGRSPAPANPTARLTRK
jgi:transposase